MSPENHASGNITGVYPDGNRSIWLLGMLITFRAVAEETGGEYSLYEQTVPPQLGPPPHIHHKESEAFYVMEGEFEFLKGDQTIRAGVGSFVRVPPGVPHAFRNVGEAPARFLAIVTPGGLHEKLLGEIGEPAQSESLPSLPDGPPDVERIVRIAQKYATEIPPLPA
jgi:quercetin dioxygenase-like cupin family protein